MSTYSYTVSNVTLNTAADIMTIIPPASRRVQLIEVSISGMGTSSAANEVGIYRSTAGTTGGGAITAAKMSTDAPAAGSTVDTTWSVQPTLGTKVLALGCNSNGGIYRWVARPGEEIETRGGVDQISIRAAVGSGNVSLHAIVVEDPQ
jgi:hypothetical protein